MFKTSSHTDFLPLEHLVDLKKSYSETITVVIPCLNEEKTIGLIIDTVRKSLMDAVSFVDEILVMDGGSTDNSCVVACNAGAKVFDSRTLGDRTLPPGKGTALWKSQYVASGTIIVCIDADIIDFTAGFVYGLAGALIENPDCMFAKGFYRRPLTVGGKYNDMYGGRVTEIMVRPFLALFYPELAKIHQPLSGEYAFRKDMIKKVPFYSGYGVEIALLIDIIKIFGYDAICQVDLDIRYHRNRPVKDLGIMAFGILRVLFEKLKEDGRIDIQEVLPMVLPLYLNNNFKEFQTDQIEIAPFINSSKK